MFLRESAYSRLCGSLWRLAALCNFATTAWRSRWSTRCSSSRSRFFRYRRKLRIAPSPTRRAARASTKASACKRLKSDGPAANKGRYSLVLFHSPNPDAVISCLGPCQGPDNPPKFAPITAGEHLRARAEASRRHGYWPEWSQFVSCL